MCVLGFIFVFFVLIGCPFRHSDPELLKQKLQVYKVPPSGIGQVGAFTPVSSWSQWPWHRKQDMSVDFWWQAFALSIISVGNWVLGMLQELLPHRTAQGLLLHFNVARSLEHHCVWCGAGQRGRRVSGKRISHRSRKGADICANDHGCRRHNDTVDLISLSG